MSLTLEAKKAIVDEVNSIAAEAPSAIAAEYIGLTVTEMTELRKAAREAGVYLKVVRNTLAKLQIFPNLLICLHLKRLELCYLGYFPHHLLNSFVPYRSLLTS